MTYWTAKTVADLTSLAPDMRNYLIGLKVNQKLSCLAAEYRMHPLMVPCWTCLIGKVVKDFGEAGAKNFLRDDNQTAEAALADHLKKYGHGLPPSLTILMTDCQMKKVKKVLRRKEDLHMLESITHITNEVYQQIVIRHTKNTTQALSLNLESR